jgi:RNA polymerase-binding transcription factor DksA
MDPLGSEADTREFLDEQVGRLRRLASDTQETRLRLNEEIESLISIDDGIRTDNADEDGSGDISAVELESLRLRLAESDRSLAEIDAALTRIEEGTYGLSRGLPPRSIIQSAASSEPTLTFIPAERLEALPAVAHNINELSPEIPFGYVGGAAAAATDDGNDQDIPESNRPRRSRSRRSIETVEDSESSEPENQRQPVAPADIGPLPGRRRTTRLDDPKELDRPIFVPDYSNYKLPYDPSKTYQAPTATNSSMLASALGIRDGLLAERESRLADVVRAAFDSPDWSDSYALGRMFNIVDEATDLDSDEGVSAQAQETMERVQEMLLTMYDNAIALAEVTKDSDTIKIDMSEDE